MCKNPLCKIIVSLSIIAVFASMGSAKESTGFISVYDDTGAGFGAVAVIDSAALDINKTAILQRKNTLNKYVGKGYCSDNGYILYRLFLPPGMKQSKISIQFMYNSNAIVYFMVESGTTTMDLRSSIKYASTINANTVYSQAITNNGNILIDNSGGQLDSLIGESGQWVYLAIANDTAIRSSGFNDGVDTDFLLEITLELKKESNQYETWRRLAYFAQNGDPVQTQYSMKILANQCDGGLFDETFPLEPSSDNECIRGKSIYETFASSMLFEVQRTPSLKLEYQEQIDITPHRIYYNNDIPYAPNDLLRLRFFIPIGAKSAEIEFEAKPDSTVPIYHKLIVSDLLKIDTLDNMNSFESNDVTELYGVAFLKEKVVLKVDTSKTFARGGWVYFDIVRDPYRPGIPFVADNTPQLLDVKVSLDFENADAVKNAVSKGTPVTDPVERIILRSYRNESKGESGITEIYCLDNDRDEVKPPMPAKYDEMEAFNYQIALLGSSAAFSCDIPKIQALDLCSLYKDVFGFLDGEFSLGPCKVKASLLECQAKQFDQMCKDFQSSLEKSIMEKTKTIFQLSGVESVISNINDTLDSGSCSLFDSATEKAEQQAFEKTDELYKGIDLNFFQLEQYGSRTQDNVLNCVYQMKKQGASTYEIQQECHPNQIIEKKLALKQERAHVESEQIETVGGISTAAITGLKENSAQEKDTKNKLIDQCGDLKESAAIGTCEKKVYEENNFKNKSASLLADLKSRKAVAQKLAKSASSTDDDIVFGTAKQSEILPIEKQDDFNQVASRDIYYDIINDSQFISMQKLEEEMLQINQQKREIMATPLYEQHIQNEVAKMF